MFVMFNTRILSACSKVTQALPRKSLTLKGFEGESRFGKTESVRAWANMHPGRARLVAVPCTNSDTDLYKEVAESLGMEVNLSRNKLKDRVEFVLQNGRLGIIFDEAAFLIQQRYSANTPPMRLNWIRTQIVDKKLPVALCVTPQNYTHALARFVKRTGHNIQQFLGRTMLKIVLPNELDEEDLLAVARINFPELDEDYLGLIAAKAMQSESYLMAVEAIAKRTRFIARRDGHSTITLADLELAISEVLPGSGVDRQPQPAQPLQRPRNRAAQTLQTPSRAKQLRQELRPLADDVEEFSSADRSGLKHSLSVPIPI